MPPSRTRAKVEHDPCAEAGRECSLVRDLFTLQNLMMRTGDRLSGPAGLTASRWLLLVSIARGGGTRSVSDLAGDALLSVQATSRMLAAMEDEGLVLRSRHGGRGLAVRLTARGRRVFERTGKLAERYERAFFRGMSRARLERLRGDCARLIENLRDFEGELCEGCS